MTWFQNSVFESALLLSSARFISEVSFDGFKFEILKVGGNPALGWLYEKKKHGVIYSLEDACEMCGHSSPLEGWLHENTSSEKLDFERWRWKPIKL